MRLAHYRLPGIVRYGEASKLQQLLVDKLLKFKANPSSHDTAPDPAIITAQFHPVYTCGRREIGTVSPKQQAYLRADGRAEFVEALRGGQTTFHGPGQLVAYPIIDLRRHGISPRDYVCLLEKILMATCANYGIKSFTTEHPGVWTSPEKKIAALGVHLRRHVTSHGVGLNISTEMWWFDRIVACGLEGKRTTSFEMENVFGHDVEEVAEVFVSKFAERLNIEEIYQQPGNESDNESGNESP